jgi:hypothetical protein
MEQERKGASTTQKVGGGILLATIILGMIGFFYAASRNIKRN